MSTYSTYEYRRLCQWEDVLNDDLKPQSSAYQEGCDAALLSQPLNPYRRAMRALTDPGSLETLGKLAQEWEDGYVSNSR